MQRQVCSEEGVQLNELKVVVVVLVLVQDALEDVVVTERLQLARSRRSLEVGMRKRWKCLQ